MENIKSFVDYTAVLEKSRSEKNKELRKAQDAMLGKWNNIFTICIMSPQNPLGEKGTNRDNRVSKKKFERTLKQGYYAFQKVLGKYGQYEDSYFIYNISLEDAKRMNLEYKQDSFIFITKDGGELNFNVFKYRTEGGNAFYENTGSYKGSVSDEREAVDFFTKVGKKFKFSIPFDQSVFEQVSAFAECYANVMEGNKESFGRYLIESMDDRLSGHAKYTRRMMLYGKSCQMFGSEISGDAELLPNGGCSEIVCESSFNRVVGWIKNNEIAIVTAFRGKRENVENPSLVKNDGKKDGDTYTHKENRERNRELIASLLRLGYGVTKVKGVYIENFGTSDARNSDEESVLVVNKDNDPKFYESVFKLSEYYNQDCFCYKAKDDDVGYLVGTNSSPFPGYSNRIRNGKFVANIGNEFMTRLKNKGFAFTDDESDKQSYDTSHASRKEERIRKRAERSINEEFRLFSDFGIGGKRSIALLADPVINAINPSKDIL